MADRILTPEEISALLDYTLPIRSDVHPDDADAALIAAAPDLARTALAAMAVARRLADGWSKAVASQDWLKANGTGGGTFEPMTDDESAFWAALEGTSDG